MISSTQFLIFELRRLIFGASDEFDVAVNFEWRGNRLLGRLVVVLICLGSIRSHFLLFVHLLPIGTVAGGIYITSVIGWSTHDVLLISAICYDLCRLLLIAKYVIISVLFV